MKTKVIWLLLLSTSVLFLLPVDSTMSADLSPPVIDTTGRTAFFELFACADDLMFADVDARDVAVHVTGWAGQNIIVSNTQVPATRDYIESWFKNVRDGTGVPRAARPGDVILFYFAGHGAYIPPDDPNWPAEFRGLAVIRAAPGADRRRRISASDLASWIEAFPAGVRFSFIFDACYSATFYMMVAARVNVDLRPVSAIGQVGKTIGAMFREGKWQRASYTFVRLLGALADDGTGRIRADSDGDGVVTIYEVYRFTTRSPWGYQGDDDGDGKFDEDSVEHNQKYDPYDPDPIVITHGYIDNDNDTRIDEDPPPQYIEFGGPGAVGGVVIPIDKLALLVPYIGLASTIVVATVATIIYVKRRKEKQ